ncbi:MAG TPA: MFS transporter [Rhizomicrobium sp.]|nr:MFS transporter [Rhizomicrobium sp.]
MTSAVTQKPTHVRHIVLFLAVLVYMITYIDRTFISTAIPAAQKELLFSDAVMGSVLAAHQLAYGLFQIPAGWLADRFGPRWVLASLVLWWCGFMVVTSFSGSVISLQAGLFLFGAGEAGAFPVANRALSRWLLPSERAFAQGATHAGSRFGGFVTPFFVVIIIQQYGWRAPFWMLALIGVFWVAIWLWYYRDSPAEHKSVNDAERTRIEAAIGKAPARSRVVPWGKIITSRNMWTLALMYACYSVILIIFLTWFPKYLISARHVSLQTAGSLTSIVLAAGLVGDLLGGIASDFLLHRTGRVTFSRRIVAITGFIITAVMIPVSVLSADMTVSIACFGVAVFGLELTVSNSWAVTLDIGGSFAGSCSAVMNSFGNLCSAIFTFYVGAFETRYGWDAVFFTVAGAAVLAALLFSRIDAHEPLMPAAAG